MSSSDNEDEGGECSLVLSAMIHQYLQRSVDPQLAASYKEALGGDRLLPDLPSETPRLTDMVAAYLGDDHASEDSDSEKDEVADNQALFFAHCFFFQNGKCSPFLKLTPML